MRYSSLYVRADARDAKTRRMRGRVGGLEGEEHWNKERDLEDRERERERVDYWLTRHGIDYGEEEERGGGLEGGLEYISRGFSSRARVAWTSLIPRVSFKSRFRRKLPVLRDKIAAEPRSSSSSSPSAVSLTKFPKRLAGEESNRSYSA